MSRPASQHLRILLDAGLVTEQRHGRERRYTSSPNDSARCASGSSNTKGSGEIRAEEERGAQRQVDQSE
jgi:DNA-binding transcriptional ArsR family regulator